MTDKIIIMGGGGHAKVVISILKKNKNFEILGYTDVEDKGEILGISYLGDDSIIENADCKNIALGIGSVGDVNFRKNAYDLCKKLDLNLPIIISKDAIVNEEVAIEEGTIIMDGVVVQSGTKIGKCSIINTNSSVDHDCKIGDFIHLAPGVTLSGNVEIQNETHVGTGANIIQGIKLGSNVMVGAGSTVVKDCNNNKSYVGVPAKER